MIRNASAFSLKYVHGFGKKNKKSEASMCGSLKIIS